MNMSSLTKLLLTANILSFLAVKSKYLLLSWCVYKSLMTIYNIHIDSN